MAPPASAACPGSDARPTPHTLAVAQTAIQCLVGEARTQRDRRRLTAHARLAVAAGAHAADMAQRDFLSHVSPGGGTLGDRLRRAGWTPEQGPWSAGEVIAWGSGAAATPRRIVRGWLRSAGHRRQLLGRASHLGVGVASGGARTYYAVVVGRGGRPPAPPG